MTKTPDFKIEMTHENLGILREAFAQEWADGVETSRLRVVRANQGHRPDMTTQRHLDDTRAVLDGVWEMRRWESAAFFAGQVAGAIRYWEGVR